MFRPEVHSRDKAQAHSRLRAGHIVMEVHSRLRAGHTVMEAWAAQL